LLLFKKPIGQASRIVLVFGGGLIGSAIERHLAFNGFQTVGRFDSSWSHPARLSQQLATLVSLVEGHSKDVGTEIHGVWSAGRGGFASSETDLEHEVESFERVAAFFDQLLPKRLAVFHFLSSAGGLFEGQTLVDSRSLPMPRRVYGQMKASQELRVRKLAVDPFRQVRIYRPSTVYGAREFSYRSGLVSHLVWNALRNYPTTLEANLHALRDFVFVDDVGRFIVQKIQQGLEDPQDIFHLVSGKPSSIFEVVQRIQRLLGKSLLYQCSDRNRNDADLTFSPCIRPSGWLPSDLDYGLHAVLRDSTRAYHERAYV
jgi:UDP-glucose 4-epimerase